MEGQTSAGRGSACFFLSHDTLLSSCWPLTQFIFFCPFVNQIAGMQAVILFLMCPVVLSQLLNNIVVCVSKKLGDYSILRNYLFDLHGTKRFSHRYVFCYSTCRQTLAYIFVEGAQLVHQRQGTEITLLQILSVKAIGWSKSWWDTKEGVYIFSVQSFSGTHAHCCPLCTEQMGWLAPWVELIKSHARLQPDTYTYATS